MAFNKFWVLLVLVLLYFSFFNIALCVQLANLSHNNDDNNNNNNNNNKNLREHFDGNRFLNKRNSLVDANIKLYF